MNFNDVFTTEEDSKKLVLFQKIYGEHTWATKDIRNKLD